MLVTSAPVTRTGLLSLLTLGVKADLTISGGLHCGCHPSGHELMSSPVSRIAQRLRS